MEERDAGRTGRGPLSVLALLVPSLGIAAVGVYHLCGFDLHAVHGRPHLDDGLTMAGVIMAVVMAGAALGDLLWWAAKRDRPVGDNGEPCPHHPLRSPRPSRSEWPRTPGSAKK
ncbi:hypothetical protein GCM10011579_005210 [Streptomyces albiflavescens]|uniref:Uncharacterized protein n=1 Tax=Streptomyces albiflavescens TaxID=1623582 RepID=A0A918CZ27_9ACTN|nr:hypothetical protein [Streptomyces albiflavescens]GGN50432.1 hypothetical protein GCM10011579_005210 [Streptomyces albiflavescens]